MPRSSGKGYKQLTESDKDEIVQMFSDKIGIRQIAKIFPCTVRAVPLVLKERGIIAKRKNRYALNEHYFDNINTEQQAYWLGFIMADGCITTSNYFAFTLAEKDKDMVYQLAKDLQYTGSVYTPDISSSNFHRTNSYRINFSSKLLCDALRKLNITEHKALREDVPMLSENLMRHFIRGMFDGDGSVYTSISTVCHNGKRYEYYSVGVNIACSYTIGLRLQSIIEQGIAYTPKLHKHNSKNCWYINILNKKSIKDFYHFMYSNSSIFILRKRNKYELCMSACKE